MVREAHVTNVDGIVTPVAITAATFDPTNQLLVTGAADGTLKVWNFSTGTCMRNMSVGRECVVAAIVWLQLRILVMGENRVVAEFSDTQDVGASNFKSWAARHKYDVMAAAARPPHTLVTGSYSGELVFWMLETGQAFGMYDVARPKHRQTLQYRSEARTTSARPHPTRPSIAGKARSPSSTRKSFGSTSSKSKVRVHIGSPDEPCRLPTNGVTSLLFLTTRPLNQHYGALLVGTASGSVQVWTDAVGGAHLESFRAVHAPADYVTAMASDANNEYLVTGHYAGYLKVWLVSDYCVPEEARPEVSLPKLRLKFPFMWGSVIVGRAQRAKNREASRPLLLSSIRAHFLQVRALACLDRSEVVISCSDDCTARMWTLAGRYLTTLGTFKPFDPLPSSGLPPPPPPHRHYSMPADVKRFGSSTTIRVSHDRKFQMSQIHNSKSKKKKIKCRKIYLFIHVSNIL